MIRKKLKNYLSTLSIEKKYYQLEKIKLCAKKKIKNYLYTLFIEKKVLSTIKIMFYDRKKSYK